MEMSAFPDIKTHGKGQIGKKGCRQKKGMLGKLADIDVSARHVADMLPTFPTKPIVYLVKFLSLSWRCSLRRGIIVAALPVVCVAASLSASWHCCQRRGIVVSIAALCSA